MSLFKGDFIMGIATAKICYTDANDIGCLGIRVGRNTEWRKERKQTI